MTTKDTKEYSEDIKLESGEGQFYKEKNVVVEKDERAKMNEWNKNNNIT